MSSTRKPIRIIQAAEIRRYYSMPKAILAMERAFASLSAGESFVPQRYVTQLPSNQMSLLFKPAFVKEEKRVSVKILTQRDRGSFPGIPTIQGVVLLMNADSGEILSIMDGEYLTALRTGAASGLATRLFSREDAQIMALFGCGTQGRTQLEAVVCERNIQKVLVFDIRHEIVNHFIKDMRDKLDVEIVFAENTRLLKNADIICTATNSTQPLFKRADLKEGVHINAIGSFRPHMQEIDPYVVSAAKVYVDQLSSCLKESGDLIKPLKEGIIHQNHIVGEIGDVCLNKIEGRTTPKEITLFKSVGVAIQDFAVATDIFNTALKEDYGQDIDLFE